MIREAILQQFEPDIAVALIEFGKSLSRIDADVILFMARKSLCLYDVLLRLGVPPIERCVVSDRVLDLDLEPLSRKRIALIDDSLIVGTTLAKSKRLLQERADATVSTHAFCVDRDWWCRDLVQPDTVSLEVDDRRAMTFCAAEARALSLLPRPYIVDYPISRQLRVRNGDLQDLLTSVEWTNYKVSTELQHRHGVSSYTFFPSEALLATFASALGESLSGYLNIVKIRAFARQVEDAYWFQLVPIVTLKPIRNEDLTPLLTYIVQRISAHAPVNLGQILGAAQGHLARQRLAQYCLSAALGQRFMETVATAFSHALETGYDHAETDRHYGPWLHDPLRALTDGAFPALFQHGGSSHPPLNVRASPGVPVTVKQWSDACLSVLAVESGNGSSEVSLREDSLNLVSTFTEVFLNLYDTKEIPARREARSLGVGVLEATPEQAPNKDRLDMGVPWGLLVEHCCSLFGLETTFSNSQLLSLVLDICNDSGITVPVTCLREGVVFRAYRHGEDVRFSDSELSLAHEAVSGMLKAARRQSVPRLQLEKLLVLLIKIGAAKKFLEPLYGASGAEGVAKVGFNLKGAVPLLTRGPRDRADRDIWLSRYLVHRGVLRVGANNQYILGKATEGNYFVSDAPDQAYELGTIMGKLLKQRTAGHKQDGPLDNNSLTILATCWPPRHCAGAIQVEVDLFRRWYEEKGRKRMGECSWSEIASLTDTLTFLTRSEGHEAIHSARMKYVAYKADRVRDLVEKCAHYLEQSEPDDLCARRWSSYWKALADSEPRAERETFDSLIDEAASACWRIGACLYSIELIIRCRIASIDKSASNAGAVSDCRLSFHEYNDAMRSTGLAQPSSALKLEQRFRDEEVRRLIDIESEAASAFIYDQLDKLMPVAARAVETIEPMLERFGRLYGRHDYSHMLYYDIVDSTATKLGRSGADVEGYRAEVRRFKTLANEILHSTSIRARKAECQLYCTRGSESSPDDAKHVFLSGKFARRYAAEVLEALVSATRAFSRIRLRVLIVPCNFAGTSAYKLESDVEVSGERFWEHWSRLKKASDEFDQTGAPGQCFLLLATDELVKRFPMPSNLVWSTSNEQSITSEIEMLERRTAVKYGLIMLGP
jgi:hypothetical protein